MLIFIKLIYLILFMTVYQVNSTIRQYSPAPSLINIDDLPNFAKGLEKELVDEATIAWMNTVTTYGDTSEQVAELYSDDAVLWGTVSEDLRYTNKDIRNYFEYFANIPGLTVKPGSFKSVVQVFGKRRNIAISSGYYEFVKPDGHGGITSIPARFTFAYKKQKYGNKWEIINHHSSIVPKQPKILQGVLNRVRNQKYKELDSYQLHLRQRENYCHQLKEYKKN